MTITLIPYPFKPIRSFLAYAVGEEKAEVKTEWAAFLPSPSIQIVRKAAA